MNKKSNFSSNKEYIIKIKKDNIFDETIDNKIKFILNKYRNLSYSEFLISDHKEKSVINNFKQTDELDIDKQLFKPIENFDSSIFCIQSEEISINRFMP